MYGLNYIILLTRRPVLVSYINSELYHLRATFIRCFALILSDLPRRTPHLFFRSSRRQCDFEGRMLDTLRDHVRTAPTVHGFEKHLSLLAAEDDGLPNHDSDGSKFVYIRLRHAIEDESRLLFGGGDLFENRRRLMMSGRSYWARGRRPRVQRHRYPRRVMEATDA